MKSEHDQQKLTMHRLKIREHNLLMRIAGETDPVAKAERHALNAVINAKIELMLSAELSK